MESTRRGKTKRAKSDHVFDIALSYFQKMNYTNVGNDEVTVDEFLRDSTMESKVSIQNSILYSRWSMEPQRRKDTSSHDGSIVEYVNLLEKCYLKFLCWLKEMVQTKPNVGDLGTLTGPLFCYMYLLIEEATKSDQTGNRIDATSFFVSHINSFDKNKSDDTVRNLITAIESNTTNLSGLKETFRTNKYAVQLSETSVKVLKNFIAERCHPVFIEIVNKWFDISEVEDQDQPKEEEEEPDREEEALCNGYIHTDASDLSNVIAALNEEISPIFVATLNNVKDTVSCGLIDKPRSLVVYCHTNSIYLRSLQTLMNPEKAEQQEIIFRGHSGRIFDVKVVQGCDLIVSASNDKTLRIHNTRNYELQSVLKGHTNSVYCTASTSNGMFIASGSADCTVRLWSVEHSTNPRIFAGHRQEITCIDYHANDIYIACGSADKNIRMYDITDATPVRLFCGSKGTIYVLKFSPNGKYIASAGEDQFIRIWDIISAKQFVELKVGPEPVTQLIWSSDDKYLLCGSTEGTVNLFDFEKLMKHSLGDDSKKPVLTKNLDARLFAVEYSLNTFACLAVKKTCLEMPSTSK